MITNRPQVCPLLGERKQVREVVPHFPNRLIQRRAPKGRKVPQRRIFTLRSSAFSAPLRFFLAKSLQEKTKRSLNDAEIYLLANQPFAPRKGPEDEVHDGPEKTVMNIVPDHRRGQGKEQVNKSRQFDFGFGGHLSKGVLLWDKKGHRVFDLSIQHGPFHAVLCSQAGQIKISRFAAAWRLITFQGSQIAWNKNRLSDLFPFAQ